MSMMSETEKAYRNMLGESNELREPMSRKEKLLHKMLGEDIELEPPQSIEEELLLQIIEQGGGGGGGGGDLSSATLTITDNRDPATVSMVSYNYCGCLEADEWDDDYSAGTYPLMGGIQQGDPPQILKIALYKGKSLITFETPMRSGSQVTGSCEWMDSKELMISGDCSIEFI